jgi:hypothetical protein
VQIAAEHGDELVFESMDVDGLACGEVAVHERLDGRHYQSRCGGGIGDVDLGMGCEEVVSGGDDPRFGCVEHVEELWRARGFLEQDSVEVGLVEVVLDRRAHEQPELVVESVGHRACRQVALDDADATVDMVLDELDEDRVFVREVLVQRPDRDAGRLSISVCGARGIAVARENVTSSAKDPLAGLRGAPLLGLFAGLERLRRQTCGPCKEASSQLLSNGDGGALLGANCRETYYGSGVGGWNLACSERGVTRGDASDDDVSSRRLAFRYMADHVGRLPVVMAARVGRTWSVYRPLQLARETRIEGRPRAVSIAGLAMFYLLAPAVVGGVVVLRRRRVTSIPLLGTIVMVTLIAALVRGEVRFRIPAEVAIVVLAAVAIDAMAFRYKKTCPGRELSLFRVDLPRSSRGPPL